MAGQPQFHDILDKHFIKLVYSIHKSNNWKLVMLYSHSIEHNGIISRNLACVKQHSRVKAQLEENAHRTRKLKELIDNLEGDTRIDNFSYDDIYELIYLISTF